MAGENDARRLIDDSRNLMDDSKQVFDDVQQLYDNMRTKGSLGEYYQRNPYAVLAAAAGVGYLLGGGLFSPFTKRITKLAMKGLVIPIASSQVKNLSGSVHPSETSFEGSE
jgi:hypothetical protein